MTENELLNSFCHLFLLQWLLLRLLEILEDVKNVSGWSAGWSNLNITNWIIIVACVCVWSQTGPVSDLSVPSLTLLCMPFPITHKHTHTHMLLSVISQLQQISSVCSASLAHQWTMLFDPCRGWFTHCDLGKAVEKESPPHPTPPSPTHTDTHP